MYALHLWPVAKRVARTKSIDMPLRTPRLVTTRMLNAFSILEWHPGAKRVTRTISIDMPLRTPRLVTTPMLNAFFILEWHPGGELYPIRLNDRPRAASEKVRLLPRGQHVESEGRRRRKKADCSEGGVRPGRYK